MPGKKGMNKGNMGGEREGAGRKRIKFTGRKDDHFIMERETIGGLDPFHKPEKWRVLSVSMNEIEFQCGNDIITLRRPDEE